MLKHISGSVRRCRFQGYGIVCIALLCTIWATPAYAQDTGTIWGMVQDSAGAVTPGTQVTATNIKTGQTQVATSRSDGAYYLNSLPLGIYRLEAEHSGFKKYAREGVTVNVNENARIDITLDVGNISELVTVTQDAAIVETNSAMESTLVDSVRLRQLPLNGRNPLQLQFLTPGVTAASAESGGENVGVSINGSRGTMNNYMIDGGNAVDGFTNTAQVFPSPDALQEFSVIQFSLSAEYGRSGGGTINAVTKSGTNRFHGGLFEFVRNDKFNARSFFAPSRQTLRQNQFGGVIGGPVFLPRFGIGGRQPGYDGRDRTFFFVSYQGTIQRFAATTTIPSLPSDLERQGNFSQAAQKPIDPRTGLRFPNDIIPASRIDPASRNFIDTLLPKSPNGLRGPLFLNVPSQSDLEQFLVRIDHNITKSNRLSFRYFRNNNKPQSLASNNIPGFEAIPDNFVTNNYVVSDTHSFSPNLLNDFHFSFSRVADFAGPLTSHSFDELGVRINPLEINGKRWMVLLTPDFRANGLRASDEERSIFQYTDTVSYVRGRQVLKFGTDMRFGRTDLQNGSSGGGFFNFAAQFSKVGFADFLLGLPTQFLQDAGTHQLGRIKEFDFFIQDDLKVSQRLTLNLGLRYEPRIPQYEENGNLATFRSGQKSQRYTKAPVGLVFVGDAGIPRGTFSNDLNNFAPRAGFAWDLFGNGRTSLRGGYGIFYDNIRWAKDERQSTAEPFTRSININAPGSFVDPYGVSGITNPFPFDQQDSNNPNFIFTSPVTQSFYDPNFRVGYVQEWMFNIEQQLASNSMLRVGYVGSKGTKLWVSREYNAAVFIPGQSTVGNIDSRRPLAPNFASLDISESKGTSNYNALQISFEKRYSRGITFLTSYTFSKSLDLGSRGRGNLGVPNPNNLNLNRGRSDFDITHVYVGSFVWDLPFFKNHQGAWAKALGGWQLNGISNIRSGIPFSVAAGTATSLSGTGGERADLIGDPSLSGGGSKDAMLLKFFNTAAFTRPPDGSWGNSGRNILDGPGLVNFDFGLVKFFKFTESQNLELRLEAFNAFNHANFGNPNATLTSPNFGRILSAGPGRVVQLGAKYSF
jgi:hypothetical protein